MVETKDPVFVLILLPLTVVLLDRKIMSAPQLPQELANLGPILDALQNRRSTTALADRLPEGITPEHITYLVRETINHSPSPFNLQSCRVVVLCTDEHFHFWNICDDVLKDTADPGRFALLQHKTAENRRAYGTVLFYEDAQSLEDLPQRLGPLWATVKDNLPEWVEHAQGFNHHTLWTLLSNTHSPTDPHCKIGASLHHYGGGPASLLDARVAQRWNLPHSWSLRAQLVFGEAVAASEAEQKQAIAPDNVRIFLRT